MYDVSNKKIVDKLLIQFQRRFKDNSPLLVGIDGLGGAGKTTIVKWLETELNTQNCKLVTIQLDNHIVERKKRYHTGHEEWYEYYYLQWDVEAITNHVFTTLCNNNRKINIPFYDITSDSAVTKEVHVPADSIVLIEGVFLQRQEWRSFFDYVIYLDCPLELRYQRVLNRDSYLGDVEAILKKYENRYWPAEKYYLDVVRPTKIADLVLKIKANGEILY